VRARPARGIQSLRIDPWRQPLRELAAAAAGAGENPLTTGSEPFALSLAAAPREGEGILRARGVRCRPVVWFSAQSELPAVNLCFPVIVKPARKTPRLDHPGLGGQDRGGARRACSPYSSTLPSACPGQDTSRGAMIYVSLWASWAANSRFSRSSRSTSRPCRPDRTQDRFVRRQVGGGFVGARAPDRSAARGCHANFATRWRRRPSTPFGCIGCGLRPHGTSACTPNGTPYIIDVNPNCDLSDLAGGFLPCAKTGGLSYKDVILRLISLALARRVDETPDSPGEPPSESGPRCIRANPCLREEASPRPAFVGAGAHST